MLSTSYYIGYNKYNITAIISDFNIKFEILYPIKINLDTIFRQTVFNIGIYSDIGPQENELGIP
jgi:hypothetical protein